MALCNTEVPGFSAKGVEQRLERCHLEGKNAAHYAEAAASASAAYLEGQSSAYPETSENSAAASDAYLGGKSADNPECHLTSAYVCFSIFGVNVTLPAGSFVTNQIGKIVEIGGDFPTGLAETLQSQYPDLLIELVDDVLVFQMPSSSATDCLNVFDPQVDAYLQRHGREDIGRKSSSALFHVPGQRSHVCADYTIHDKRGYAAKVAAARALRRTIPQNVRVYVTIEMQSFTQTEQYIRDLCVREAMGLNCISIALLVKTGFVEIYDSSGQLRHVEYNPAYIDIGLYSPYLKGLRLYMECLRAEGCWSYPSPHNNKIQGHRSSLMRAISSNDFDLAEEVINHMCGEALQDEGPLRLAAEKAIQHVPGALQFVHYLLQNGAPVDTDTQCISTMLVATAAHDGPLISLLQQYGAPPSLNLRPDDLVFAIEKGDPGLITLLIRAGCDPNEPSEDGRLPLIEAIPRMSLVNAIINPAGHLDIHKKDRHGNSAMKYAKKLNMVEIIQRLKEKERMQGGAPKKTYLAQLITKTLFKKSRRNQQGEREKREIE